MDYRSCWLRSYSYEIVASVFLCSFSTGFGEFGLRLLANNYNNGNENMEDKLVKIRDKEHRIPGCQGDGEK